MRKIVFLLLTFSGLVFGLDKTTYIPTNFYPLADTLKKETDKTFIPHVKSELFPNQFFYATFGGLFEHESCITLKRKRCWSSKSELKTYWKNGLRREHGVGLGQVTRAWRSNGMLRLDVLADLKRRYPKDLKGVTWKNLKDNPDIQMRISILLYTSNYRRLSKNIINEFERLAFADSAYNGGLGYIFKDRKLCGLKKGCNPNIWFGHVETINSRGNKILYGNRTANQINRYHVDDVLLQRLPKYFSYYIEEEYKKINKYK